MVRLFVSSLTILVVSLALVKAQEPIVVANYPKVNAVPPVDSPEVIAWLKEIDFTGAPAIPLHKGDPPSCPNPPIADE